MKKEYDFSNGERGKFFREGLNLNFPVYLDPDNFEFIREIAEKSNVDVNTVVNHLIKNNIRLDQALSI